MCRPRTAALAFAVGAGCSGSATPPSTPYDLPECTFTRWDQVLEDGVRLRLRTLETGRQRYPLGEVAPDVARERRDEEVEILVMAHLLEHPEHGAWLIDTGLGRAFADEPYGDLRGLAVRMALEPFAQEEGEALGEQLEELGVELVGVFFTHLHVDHTAGVPDLAGGARYVAAGEEEPTSVPGFVVHDHFAAVERLETLEPGAFPTVEGWRAADLFGDGSLWALPSPGHSPGHLSYLALLEEGPILLTGDAAHVDLNWEQELAPGFSDDQSAAKDSLDELRALWSELGEPAVVFGHGH